MEISARNQLAGTVTDIQIGAVMAEVVIDVNGSTIVAAITKDSVEKLGLAVGGACTAVIKATDVMVAV